MNIPLSSLSTKFQYGARTRPTRDWLVLLSIFGIGLVLSVVYNLVTFSSVTKGETVGNATTSVPAQIKLDHINDLFNSRAVEVKRYGSEYRFVDPSL